MKVIYPLLSFLLFPSSHLATNKCFSSTTSSSPASSKKHTNPFHHSQHKKMTSSPKYAPVSSSSKSTKYSDPNDNTDYYVNTSPQKSNPFEHLAAENYFERDSNVFYRPQRDVALGDVAAEPMGRYDWGIVPEHFTDEDRKRFEMEELQVAAVLERHPCGPEMKALLNASRSLPVGVHQTVQSKMSGSKGNFKKALEIASQAGGAGGASHSLLFSKGGPERKANSAQMKWGPVKFSDMGTVALGEKITRDVIELRRAFSKRDAIVTFPDNVTPEALAFKASRHGDKWRMFDIREDADPDSEIMKVYMNQNSSVASKKASLHGSESMMISYTADGAPVWHRMSGDKALLTSAFKVADRDDDPLIGPNGDVNQMSDAMDLDPMENNLAESANYPLPPLGDRPKGWPVEGPGHPPPSSQEGLRVKRFRLEDRVPSYKAAIESEKAKEVTGPPQIQVGTKYLKQLHLQDKEKKAKYRLPVWRALKSPGKQLDDDEAEYLRDLAAAGGASKNNTNNRSAGAITGDFSEFDPDDTSKNVVIDRRKRGGGAGTGDTPTGAERSAPRTTRERDGPMSPARLSSPFMTPQPKPEEGTYNLPLQLRAARITEDNQSRLANVEARKDARGRVIKEQEDETTKVGTTSAANSKALSQLLAPPSVPFSEVRRSHCGPLLPFMAVSGVPKFDAVTASEEQSTAWKDLLNEI